jgi:hypothetical protein
MHSARSLSERADWITANTTQRGVYMKRDRTQEITVIEYAHGKGLRVVHGEYIISAESGVPAAIRSYTSAWQAFAHERGEVRGILALMFGL